MAPALAAGIGALVALAAWAARALTAGGAASAALIGWAILAGTGWPGAAVLGAFFVPSTLVGRFGERRAAASDAQDERRGARQVLANGGPAAIGALLGHNVPALGLWVVTVSLAAAAADTWATSLGALSRSAPRLLRGWRRVPAGTSGAVSGVGSAGALAGAAVVAGTGAAFGPRPALLFWGTGLGFAGMALDSFLGAWLQGCFECPACGVSSEKRRHRCGRPTRLVKGWSWLDNDGVNALTTAGAALAGALAWRLAGR